MKKKMKSVTLGEMVRTCSRHRKCTRCPFNDFFYCGFVLSLDAEELEAEYEVEETK